MQRGKRDANRPAGDSGYFFRSEQSGATFRIVYPCEIIATLAREDTTRSVVPL
jgi:hypothetical protein